MLYFLSWVVGPGICVVFFVFFFGVFSMSGTLLNFLKG